MMCPLQKTEFDAGSSSGLAQFVTCRWDEVEEEGGLMDLISDLGQARAPSTEHRREWVQKVRSA